jgi:hypothetical protein
VRVSLRAGLRRGYESQMYRCCREPRPFASGMSLVSRPPGCRGGRLRRSVVPVQRRCNVGGDDLIRATRTGTPPSAKRHDIGDLADDPRAARLSASRQTGDERGPGGPWWECGSAGRPPHGRGPRRPVPCTEGCARSGRPLRAAASAALLDLVGDDGCVLGSLAARAGRAGSPGSRRRSGRARARRAPRGDRLRQLAGATVREPRDAEHGEPLELGRRAGLTDGDEHGDGLRVHPSRGDGQRLGWILTGSPGCVRSSPASSTSPPACR